MYNNLYILIISLHVHAREFPLTLKEHDSEVAQLISDILINETRGKGFAERTKKEF